MLLFSFSTSRRLFLAKPHTVKAQFRLVSRPGHLIESFLTESDTRMGAFSSKASTAEVPSETAPSETAPSETPSHPPPKKEEEKANEINSQPPFKKEEEKPEEVKKVSKNQRKRERKWEQKMEVKRRRKEQEKNTRIAQAKVDGRDIEKDRQTMAQNRKDGIGWAKRDAKWKEAFEKTSSKYQICLDCPFEDVMMAPEINSLSSQIRYCYAANKRAKHPVNVKVTSLGGSTLASLENVGGFEQWTHKAFDCTSEDAVSAYNDKSKLVYLTSDSDNILDTLEDGKVYIIGGIVDRNRLKRAAINRAEGLVSTTSL
jgi:tRNA (guanine9-N1)-methyltransferase